MKKIKAQFDPEAEAARCEYSKANLDEFLVGCNTIERAFFLALLDMPIKRAAFNGAFVFDHNELYYELCPQFVDATMPRMYRADYWLAVSRNYPPEAIEFIIEIDGHDWHEKTKAQAEYDKKRERCFVASGYRVLRFSGSEVFNYPIQCWQEILSACNEIMALERPI